MVNKCRSKNLHGKRIIKGYKNLFNVKNMRINENPDTRIYYLFEKLYTDLIQYFDDIFVLMWKDHRVNKFSNDEISKFVNDFIQIRKEYKYLALTGKKTNMFDLFENYLDVTEDIILALDKLDNGVIDKGVIKELQEKLKNNTKLFNDRESLEKQLLYLKNKVSTQNKVGYDRVFGCNTTLNVHNRIPSDPFECYICKYGMPSSENPFNEIKYLEIYYEMMG